MRRYLIVKHTDQTQALDVHALLGSYHWESIDSEHVLVLATIDSHSLGDLAAHPAVLVAPSIYSDDTLHAHAQAQGKPTHLLALKKLGVTSSHRTVHLAQLAEKRFGRKFMLGL